MFEDHHLFDGRGSDGTHSDAHRLAEMVAMLGPPPPDFLRKSPHSLKYWDSSGNILIIYSLLEVSPGLS
jgi:hypothetical protein